MTTRNSLAMFGAAALMLAAAAAGAEQVWQIKGGVTSVSFLNSLLHDLGLGAKISSTAPAQGDMEEAKGFTIQSASTLSYTVREGKFQGWNSGRVVTSGGIELTSANGSLRLKDFSVVFKNNGTNNNLFVHAGPSGSGGAMFEMSHIKVNFDRSSRSIIAGYADLTLTAEAAAKLGRPDLTGQLVGMLTVAGTAEFIKGDKNDPEPKPIDRGIGLDGGDVPNGDVMLWDVSGLASFGRVGSYPNGISGLGMSTTSCNVSTVTNDNVNWFQQMDERHPVICQNMYRMQTVNGSTRFEQIGVGWVKHGFLSTNSNGCGTCQNPGSGNYLGVRCSDTYGASLNASRNWLGPRNEINPFTGRWTCRGSYFSNYQPDCISRFNTNGLNAVDHRLQVYDQDLVVNPATFFYEAYYVSENDVDRYNNIAWRRCIPTWNGSSWSFSTQGGQTQGPAINMWGDVKSIAQPTTDGDVLVNSAATDLGGGVYHYEYAVYCHTLDRQVRQFTVPIPPGANITNIEFKDVDKDNTNNWTVTVGPCAITWQTDTYAQNQNANSLTWGSTFNFRFDANVAPANNSAVLGLFKPGTLQSLSAVVKAPMGGDTQPAQLTIDRGLVLAGGLSDLLCSDDSRFSIRPGVVFSTSEPPVRLILEGTSANNAPNQLQFVVEGYASQANISQTIELYNFNTSQYELVNTSAMPTSEGVTTVTISTNASRFVQSGTGAIRARVAHRAVGPVFSYPWVVNLDQTVWRIAP